MSKRKLRKSDQTSGNNALESSQASTPAQYSVRAEHSSSKGAKFLWTPFAALGAALLLVVVICFGNTMAHGIVFNDKTTFAILNITNPERFFSEQWARAAVGPLTQPWLRSSFALDFANYGGGFGWYHLVNVFLHFSACLALFSLVLRLAWRLRNEGRTADDPWKLAAVAAVIYACHPLASQAASYISARSMPLAAANYLIALNLFLLALHGRSAAAKWWGYGGTFVFGYMALLSNEVALSLPAMLLALFFLVKPKADTWIEWAIDRPLVAGILIAFCLSFPFMYFTGFEPGYAADSYGVPMLDRAAYTATQAKAFFTYYLRCFFVPFGLSIDPPYAVAKSWGDPLALLGAATAAGLLFAFVKAQSRPLMQFGLALLFAGYLPHACIVQQHAVGDSVFYLSLAGLAIVAAVAITESLQGTYKEFALKLSPLVVILTVLSILRNLDWSSDDKLFESTLRTNDNSTVALIWNADSALGKGDYTKALTKAEVALTANPNAALAWFVKANALVGQGKYEQATAAFEKTDQLATAQKLPVLSAVKLGWAENELRLHRLTAAEQLVYKSFAIDQNNQRSLYIMGEIELARGDYRKGFMYLKKAAESGTTEALAPLAEAAIRIGAYSQAETVAQMAVKFKDSPQSQYAAGISYFAVQKYDKATDAFKKVLKGQPKDAASLAFLSIIFQKQGDHSLEESYRGDALKLDPSVFSRIPLPAAPALDEQGMPTGQVAPAAAAAPAADRQPVSESKPRSSSTRQKRRHH